MRYIFYALLAGNILFAGWQLAKEPPPEPTAGPRGGPGGGIVLLRELAPSDRTVDMAEVVSNPVRLASTEDQTCFGIGPFADVFSGQNAIDQLAAIDVSAELKAMDVPTGEMDYRVYIPPAASAESAFRMLRELQASEIDSYVITQGEQALGISLGVFSTNEAASLLKSRLGSMGYTPEILPIPRISRTYWIYPPLESQAAANWLQNQPDLEMRATNCVDS